MVLAFAKVAVEAVTARTRKNFKVIMRKITPGRNLTWDIGYGKTYVCR